MTTNKQALFAAFTLPLMAALAGCGGITAKEQAPDAGAAARRISFSWGRDVFLRGDEEHSVRIPAYPITMTERKQGDITVPVIRFWLVNSIELKRLLKTLEGLAAQTGREFSVYDAGNGGDIPVSADIAYWGDVGETSSITFFETIIELRSDVFGVSDPSGRDPVEPYPREWEGFQRPTRGTVKDPVKLY